MSQDVSSSAVETAGWLDARRAAIKKEFIRVRGYWHPLWDEPLRLDPGFFEAYLGFSSVPWRHGALSPMVKEFIYTAIDAATTHLWEAGTEAHMRNALRHGATQEQLMALLEIVALMGARTAAVGTSILAEEAERAGVPMPGIRAELNDRQQAIKARFTDSLGYWTPQWEVVLRAAPEYVEAFVGLAADGDLVKALDAKTAEFVQIAVHASVASLDAEAVRIHVRRALELRATPEEVLEVLELASVLGIHSINMGAPALVRASS